MRNNSPAADNVIQGELLDAVTDLTRFLGKSVTRENSWEFNARFDWEKKYYREMHLLAEMFHGHDPLNSLVRMPPETRSSLAKIISNIIAKEGEILFVPFDQTALAAVRNIVTNWRRILGCTLKIVNKNFIPPAFSNNSLFVFAAAKKPDEELLLKILQKKTSPHLWIGLGLTKVLEQIFQRSVGYCILNKNFSCNRADVLYAGVSLLLAYSWNGIQSKKAETVQKHLMHTGSVIDGLLNNVSIKNSLVQAMAVNRGYKTAFFIGPPTGTGIFWEGIFKQARSRILEFHLFGESVHGPIVTVDSKIEDKFVKLENKKQMVQNYGKDNFLQWERIFLGDTKIDDFLSQPPGNQPIGINTPFFAEEGWYLPVLRNDYDSSQDNLIIVDATSERYFPLAIDELATYGCRYARMIVLSQEAFRKDAENKILFQYPISHLIELPALAGKNDATLPISDFLLPFSMNLLGVAMASTAAEK